MEAVGNRMGCASRIRADAGTENGIIGEVQTFLRSSHTDKYAGDKSFLVGPSTNNQRIESFWGQVRKQAGQFWMNLFAKLHQDGLFNGSKLDKGVIRFCFMDMIQVRAITIFLSHMLL